MRSRKAHFLALGLASVFGLSSCDTLSNLLNVEEPWAALSVIDLVRSPSTNEMLAWACYEYIGSSTTCGAVGYSSQPSNSDMIVSFDVVFDLFNPNEEFSIPLLEMLLGMTVYEGTNLGAVCVSFCDPDDPDCTGETNAEGGCAAADGAKGLEDFEPTVDDLVDLAEDLVSGDVTDNWDWRVIPAYYEDQCVTGANDCTEETNGDVTQMCCDGECTDLEPGCSVGSGDGGSTCALCDGYTEAHINFNFGVDTMLDLSEDLLSDALEDVLAGRSVKLKVPYTAEGSLFFDVPDMGTFAQGFGPFEDEWEM